jgi:hypothetical protein
MSKCGYEGCDVDTGARPYANKGVPSVTTIIDQANLGDRARAFTWYGGEKAAIAAVHDTAKWWDLPSTVGDKPCTKDHKICAICDRPKADHVKQVLDHRFVSGLCKACNWLRSQAHYDTKAKGDLGGHLHHLALSWAQGQGVETDEVTDPYMDGLEAWYAQYQPQWAALEQTVYYQSGPREYVGSFDALGSLLCSCELASEGGRCLYLLDIKTGSGQWDLEWMLQLSAYRYAQKLTEWADGKQHVTGKMPVVAHTAVLWLHDTGQAELVPVDTDAETFNTFLRLADLYTWEKRAEKRLADKEKANAAV